jgi:hypothetical protein
MQGTWVFLSFLKDNAAIRCTPIGRNGTEEHPGHGWASEGVVENMARAYCILLHISLDGAESDEDPANRQVQRAVEVAQRTGDGDGDGDGNHYRGRPRDPSRLVQ